MLAEYYRASCKFGPFLKFSRHAERLLGYAPRAAESSERYAESVILLNSSLRALNYEYLPPSKKGPVTV